MLVHPVGLLLFDGFDRFIVAILQNLRVDGINLLFPAVGSRVARSNHARNRARRFHIVRILCIDGVVFKRGAEFLAARFRYRQGACVAIFARFGGRVAFGRRGGFFFGGRCCLRRRSDLRRRGRFCRGGRDGLPSDTLLFYSLADLILLTKFATESGQQGINLEKLQRMQQYAEADVCRRRILLSYFGEATTEDCGNCDVCKNPPQRFDGTVIVQKALSAIVRTEQQIGTSILVDILRGNNTPDVSEKGYQQLKTFGAGREVPARDWQDYLLQMLQLGYFEIAYNENNHLKITSSGSDVLFGRAQARLAVIRREEFAPAKGRKKKSTIPVRELPLGLPNTESEELFEALRALRKRLADQEALPAYIVLSDKVLHLLSTARPITMEAFGNISGIGEYKKKKYGKDFVELIKKYV